MKLKSILILTCFCLCGKFSAQTFYNQSTLQKIQLYFSATNWDYQMDTAKAGVQGYILADSIKVNGIKMDSVGVKYKGNSSYNSTYVKNPMHIELDQYKNHSYQGFKDIKLSNCYADPSMIREVLAYDILSNYMDCPRSNFAQVYVNGAYLGLYSNDEGINNKFCAEHFFSSSNAFIKCNPTITPSPAVKSNLKTITGAIDSSSYFNYYELKSNVGWNDFVSLTNTVTSFPVNLPSVMDMDRAIWMLAFNNTTINLDSYNGVFAQNYYLYKDNNQRYNPIMWDLNMAFGGFPFSGNSKSSMGSLTIPSEQTLSAFTHSVDVYWPLINDVISDPSYKRMYIAHMKTILNEMFVSNLYQTKSTQLQIVIDTAVQSDLNKFYSYTQFQNGMTANYTVGSYSVPGITNLMSARVAYLLATPDFTYTAPSISTPTLSSTTPVFGSSVSITSQVLNTISSSVYLGYRNSPTEKFVKLVMYDDGAHNDGVSGDNIYGVNIPVLSGKIHYYIYAENSNAGMFSPQRAEHEFYTISASTISPVVGSLVINEFLAINTLLEKDEYSDREDWIELYNTTNSLLDLSNTYLSDDILFPMKWKFPNGTTVNPHSFMMVWADDDSLQKVYHTNFLLNSLGEKLMLSQGSTIIDSLTFGPQGPNITYGRCPNGTGSFVSLSTSSYNGENCTVGLSENSFDKSDILIFPNPTSNEFFVKTKNASKNNRIEVVNLLGEIVYTNEFNQELIVNSSDWKNGIYVIKVSNTFTKIIIAK